MYEIEYQEQALLDIAKLKKDEPASYKKVVSFIQELKEHPKTGTGHPEPLKGKPDGRWSRQINKILMPTGSRRNTKNLSCS